MVAETSERQLADVMAKMPYGMYIVGSRALDGEPNGMIADWVMQVSFSPRLLAVAFENDAHTLENIRADGVFTLNILAQDDESMHLASRFAQPYYGKKVKGRAGTAMTEVHHKLEGIPYKLTDSGCPVLDLAVAWLDCRAEHFISAGDHTLVIGRVLDGRIEREAEVMTSTYTGWPYSG